MLVPVYDIVDCGPRHRFVANGKLVHNSDSVNLQNLPSRDKHKKALKNALRAPPGHYIINCDSSQIEARVLAWLAGQGDVVEQFRANKDVYSIFASKVFGFEVSKAHPVQRHIGKVATLSLGYGTGAKKLQHTLKTQPPGADLPEEECKRIVDLYRQENDRIPALWNECELALNHLMTWPSSAQEYALGQHDCLWVTAHGIRLPNGLYIRYPKLQRGEKGFVYTSRKGVQPLWGGAVVENCISAGTEVLTQRGWVQIESIRSDDRVHDGVEFVAHGGLVFKSVQSCVIVDGVYMTPDHEVLTNDGWQVAAQNPEPYRPDLWLVDGDSAGAQRWQKVVMEVPMRMRQALHKAWRRCTPWKDRASLRVQSRATSVPPSNSWYEQAPGLCGISQHDSSLQAAIASSVEKLWRTRYHRVQKLAARLSVFLGRYGRDLSTWLRLGSYKQRWKLQPEELSVEYTTHERNEPEVYDQATRYPYAGYKYRDLAVNTLLPDKTRVAVECSYAQATCNKPVYDIINAGPRQRFVVRGISGPFIVHNCVQALARIIVGQQMLELAEQGLRPVLTVHDAAVLVVKKADVDAALKVVTGIMSTPPSWATGLPVACEAKYGESYGDC